MLINILIWLVLGAVAGFLANLFVYGGSGDLVSNIIVGIIGAFLGGFVFSLLGSGAEATGLNATSILVAFVGAVVFLLILKLIRK